MRRTHRLLEPLGASLVRDAVIAALASGLAWFSIRRLVFLGAALAPPRAQVLPAPTGPPSVAVAIPAHNEENLVDGLVASLERLEYPPDRLETIFVCDGCTDATVEHLRAWARERARVCVIELPRRVGKAAALNAALAVAQCEFFVVLDADLRPRPDFLSKLVAVFDDKNVAAAGALLNPSNASKSLISRYCAVDLWVTQFIVAAAKDRLRLNPPTFGASAYRRAALVEVAGFGRMKSSEDVETSLALERAGWETRFVPGAIADNAVATTVGDYWRQHLRWARGSLTARNARKMPFRGRFIHRLEAWNVAVGYLDRVLLLAAVPLSAAGLPRRVLAAYLIPLAAQVVVSLLKARHGKRLAGFALATATVFPLDLASSAAALALHLSRRPQVWRSPRARPASRLHLDATSL
jgi:cellulose synthase/poly-beta-1,6-N-acetylglucosamine synthase-like glycosyltransferase